CLPMAVSWASAAAVVRNSVVSSIATDRRMTVDIRGYAGRAVPVTTTHANGGEAAVKRKCQARGVTEHRFRFSLQATTIASRREWLALARKAEDLGFSGLMTADHLAECLPPLLPLVSAAEATTALRVCPLVINNDFRHPSLLAREAATVDLMTDGR